MQPRLIRIRDIPSYLGMDINRFNKEVRPNLIAIPIGKQGIAFDRLDLDAWVDNYKSRNGRPVVKRRTRLWDVKLCPDFKSEMESGLSIRKSSADEFARALEQIRMMKQRNI